MFVDCHITTTRKIIYIILPIYVYPINVSLCEWIHICSKDATTLQMWLMLMSRSFSFGLAANGRIVRKRISQAITSELRENLYFIREHLIVFTNIFVLCEK